MPNKNLKILIISRYPPFPGGRENFIFELTHSLAKDYRVLVLTPDQNFSRHGHLTVSKYPKSKTALKKIIKKFKPDIINSHTFYLSKDVFEIAGRLNIPSAITLHGDQFAIGNKQRQALVKEVAQLSNFIITVSKNGKQSVIKNIKGVNKKNIYVIKNGVNLKKFKKTDIAQKNNNRKKFNISNYKKIAITTSRLANYKGLDFLLGTIKDNQKFLTDNNLLFVISIPDYPFSKEEKKLFAELTEKIKKNKLKKLVKFLFLTYKKVQIAYSISDFFILPSQKEQFPISILEAMACQLPIIATRTGGVPELITNAKNGILVNFSDRNQLIKAVKKCLFSNMKQLTINAYSKIIADYSLDDVAKKYANLYKKYTT